VALFPFPVPFLFCCCQTQPILEFPHFLPSPSLPTSQQILAFRIAAISHTHHHLTSYYSLTLALLSLPLPSHIRSLALSHPPRRAASEASAKKSPPASKRYRNNFAPATFSPTFAVTLPLFLSLSSVSSFLFSNFSIFPSFFDRVCRKNYFRDFSHSLLSRDSRGLERRGFGKPEKRASNSIQPNLGRCQKKPRVVCVRA